MSLATTSPLVSLNVHEALTFEGTEICLHPDLFQKSDGSVNVRHSSTQSTITGKNQRISLTSTQSSEEKISITESTDSQNNALQAGDMIRIRVWDPLVTSPESPVSVHQKRTGLRTASSSHASVSTPQDGVELDASSNAVSRRKDVATDGKDGDTSSGSTHNSRPLLGEMISQESVGVDSMESKSEDIPPTKSVVTGNELPPVFPRSRTNTADGAPAVKSAKPPIAHRRISGATEGGSTKQKRGLPQSKPKHMRDLSDVTVDSLYPTESRSPTVLESSHQLVDLQVPMGLVGYDEEHSNLMQTHAERLSFVMKVTEKHLTTLKASARTQVSMLRQVAEIYGLSSFDMITVSRIEKEQEKEVLAEVSADFVLVTIKDQFVSRGEMHLFQRNLIGSWLYEGQRISDPVRGIKSHAREIRHEDQYIRSGIVTEDTKITFRSRSSRIFW